MLVLEIDIIFFVPNKLIENIQDYFTPYSNFPLMIQIKQTKNDSSDNFSNWDQIAAICKIVDCIFFYVNNILIRHLL